MLTTKDYRNGWRLLSDMGDAASDAVSFALRGTELLPWLVPSYVGRMYDEDRQSKPISGLAGWWIFVPLLGGFVWIWKVQSALNGFWRVKSAV